MYYHDIMMIDNKLCIWTHRKLEGLDGFSILVIHECPEQLSIFSLIRHTLNTGQPRTLKAVALSLLSRKENNEISTHIDSKILRCAVNAARR